MLPLQPVACGRRLCRGVPIPARDPSMPAQVVMSWQAAEAGFAVADISTYAGDARWAQQKVSLCCRAWCQGAVKISSLPVVLCGWISALPTTRTKCWQSLLFLFLLFFHPLHHGFHGRMAATGDQGGARSRTAPAQLVLLSSEMEKLFLPQHQNALLFYTNAFPSFCFCAH